MLFTVEINNVNTAILDPLILTSAPYPHLNKRNLHLPRYLTFYKIDGWIDRKKNFLNVFVLFFERDRDRVRAGEGQRERETHNPKQASGSELSAQSPRWGSKSRTVRS